MLLSIGILGKDPKKNNQKNEDTTFRKEKIFSNNTVDKELISRIHSKPKNSTEKKNT